MSVATIQRLQDLLYEVGSNDGVPGTSSTEQDNQLRIAGLPTRAMTDRYPATDRVFTSANSYEERMAYFASNGALWRSRIEATVQPGEAVPLVTRTNAESTHVVLAGRNRDGSLYIYDSSRVPGLLSSGNPDHRVAIEGIVGTAMGFHGSYVIRVAR